MIDDIVTNSLDIWAAAIKRKNTQGRGSSKKIELYGIKKLRELILELAVRGLLVPQAPNDEPASVLLKKIAVEKARLLKEGKIKKQKLLPPISDEEKPFELPEKWKWARLGEITNYGLSDKAEPCDVHKDTWVLELEDVEKETSKLLQKKRFAEREFRSSKNIFIQGDVIYGKLRPYLDKVLVADEDGACSTEMIPVRAYAEIIPEFLRLSMKSPHFKEYANNSTHGMNLPRLGTDKGRLALTPLCSVPEQHRIVAKVDELMALCDQLEQHTETSLSAHQTLVETLLGALTATHSQSTHPAGGAASGGKADNAGATARAANSTTRAADNARFTDAWQRIAAHFDTLFTTEHSIDQLKQSILQLAVQGKLVPQDPNDQPASELIKKIAAEKAQLIKDKKIKKQKNLPPISEEEKPFELPEGWEWCRIWSIANLITSGSRDWAKYYSEDGAIFVTMGNLSRGNYKLRMDTIRYVNPPKDGEGNRTRLEENDLLISITGDVGNLGLVPENFGRAYINQHTALLRFMNECQDRFFPELMRSPLVQYQFDAPQRGVKNSFRLSDVGEIIIPIPPTKERHRIAAKVDELMALCEQLKARLGDAQSTQLHLADAMAEQAIL